VNLNQTTKKMSLNPLNDPNTRRKYAGSTEFTLQEAAGGGFDILGGSGGHVEGRTRTEAYIAAACAVHHCQPPYRWPMPDLSDAVQ
jgi:hypothetical protein